MVQIGRRTMLALLAALPAAAWLAPAQALGRRRAAPVRGEPGLVDAHCHAFNATDLTATKFILVSFLGIYPRPSGPTRAERLLEDMIRGIIRGLSRGVPSAAIEAEMLEASLLAPAVVPDLTPGQEAEVRALRNEAEAAARRVAQERSEESSPLAAADASPARCIPRSESSIQFGLKAAVRWVRILRRYRREIVETLAARHLAAGYRPTLLCPALVDYSNWLGESLGSPLPEQVAVMGKIAANGDLPPVHGYAPFDPLRHALFKAGKDGVDGRWDPMALLREALFESGFAGVKLYPPMGFRPAGNAGDAAASYPPAVASVLGGHAAVGAHLDAALEELWAFCAREDVPVMAHASNSNVAGEDYGYRADPTHWVALLARRPSLRVMLAHFGGFQSVAEGHGEAGRPCPSPLPFEDSWEGVIGRYIQQNPDARLFADISFLGEVYDDRAGRRSRERMMRYLAFDPGARHLVFGSDWVMLGLHKGWGKRPPYASRVAAFLADCGLTGETLDGVMRGNALRFLGLGEGEATRNRLLRFYAEHRLPPERLPVVA